MKRGEIILGLFLGTFLLGAATQLVQAGGQAGTVAGVSDQDKITPFVLRTQVYAFEHDRHAELGIKTTFARRSDGATVRVESVGPLKLGLTGRMISFTDGRSLSLVDAFKMKTTWPPVPPGLLARFNAERWSASPNCLRMAGEELAGDGTITGQNVVVVRETVGLIMRRETDWRAPGLGCQNLAYKVEDQNPDGSWRLRTEGRLVKLKLGEPDPKLFDEGADYTEAKASEVYRKILEMQGIPADEAPWRQQAEQMDRGYPKR